MFSEVKPDIFGDIQRIEQRPGLENHRHAIFAHDLGRLDRFALDEDFARVGRFKPDDMLEQDGFPAAAGAHNDEDFAGMHVKVEPL